MSAMSNTAAQLEALVDDWHKAITSQDIDALMALYTDDAVIESSAVLVIEKDSGGTLHGKDKLRKHFQSFFAIAGHSDVDWYRFPPSVLNDSGRTAGALVIWEYPSKGPDGEQLDVVESFDVDNGLITYHRVYWGWRGFQLLEAQR
jgi:steroid Delta-isomerase